MRRSLAAQSTAVNCTVYEPRSYSFLAHSVGQAPERTQHRQRQAHWRPFPLAGLVGHSKDGELSLCRVLILAVSTILPGTPVDWLAAAPGFRLAVSRRAMILVGRGLHWLADAHRVKTCPLCPQVRAVPSTSSSRRGSFPCCPRFHSLLDGPVAPSLRQQCTYNRFSLA